METDVQTTFREIPTGNLMINGEDAILEKELFKYHGLPWLSTARLWYGNTLHNVEVWDADTKAGVLSSAIKQAIADGENVTATGIVDRGEQSINKEVSFMKLGRFLIGHCESENLATGRITHSISIGRFGLKKVLGINKENPADNPLQSS